jgi:hypothetical protein
MQFLPEAPELLGAIASLLDDKVLGVVPGELQHQVRVAGHLARLLEREARLGPEARRRERELVAVLLGTSADDPGADDPAAALDARLRGDDVDARFEARAWEMLVEVTRADLAICKPGHDSWEGV